MLRQDRDPVAAADNSAIGLLAGGKSVATPSPVENRLLLNSFHHSSSPAPLASNPSIPNAIDPTPLAWRSAAASLRDPFVAGPSASAAVRLPSSANPLRRPL